MTMNVHPKPGGSSYPSPKERRAQEGSTAEQVETFMKHLITMQPNYYHAHGGLIVIGYSGVEYRIPVDSLQIHTL